MLISVSVVLQLLVLTHCPVLLVSPTLKNCMRISYYVQYHNFCTRIYPAILFAAHVSEEASVLSCWSKSVYNKAQLYI